MPTVSSITTAPQPAAATTRLAPRLRPARARATQAHTTSEAAPSSVPKKAAKATRAPAKASAPGSFELIEPTCTADRMPNTTITRHTRATKAVAQPHRKAESGRGRASPRAARAP